MFLTEWSERDRGLAIGLLTLDERTTSGHPTNTVYDPDSDGWFVAEPVINHAQAAIDRKRAAEKNVEPGTEYRTWDTRVNPEKAHFED